MSNVTSVLPRDLLLKIGSLAHGSIVVMSLLSNILILLHYIRYNQVRNRPHLILALAFSDFLGGIGMLTNASAAYQPVGSMSQRMCTLVNIPWIIASAANVLVTLALGVYRYVGFKFLKCFRSMCQPVALVLLYGGILNYCTFVVIVSVRDSDPVRLVHLCTSSAAFTAVQSVAMQVILTMNLVFSSGVVAVNILLFREVRKRRQQSQGTKDWKAIRDEKMAGSLLIVTAVYMGTYILAFSGFMISHQVLPEDTWFSFDYTVTFPIVGLCYASNYVIYASRSKDYRLIWKEIKN